MIAANLKLHILSHAIIVVFLLHHTDIALEVTMSDANLNATDCRDMVSPNWLNKCNANHS